MQRQTEKKRGIWSEAEGGYAPRYLQYDGITYPAAWKSDLKFSQSTVGRRRMLHEEKIERGMEEWSKIYMQSVTDLQTVVFMDDYGNVEGAFLVKPRRMPGYVSFEVFEKVEELYPHGFSRLPVSP